MNNDIIATMLANASIVLNAHTATDIALLTANMERARNIIANDPCIAQNALVLASFHLLQAYIALW